MDLSLEELLSAHFNDTDFSTQLDKCEKIIKRFQHRCDVRKYLPTLPYSLKIDYQPIEDTDIYIIHHSPDSNISAIEALRGIESIDGMFYIYHNGAVLPEPFATRDIARKVLFEISRDPELLVNWKDVSIIDATGQSEPLSDIVIIKHAASGKWHLQIDGDNWINDGIWSDNRDLYAMKVATKLGLTLSPQESTKYILSVCSVHYY